MPSKLCNSMNLDGLIFMKMGFGKQRCIQHEPNYSSVGFDLCYSGGNGGEFIAP